MSHRELFVSLAEETVQKRCLDAHVRISVIEGLESGGTRLVCMSGNGAEAMREKFKRHLISTPVVRRRYRPRTGR
jgi:hypothetical protein